MKKRVPEELLPDFLDFVVWGHEHEALDREDDKGQVRATPLLLLLLLVLLCCLC